MRYVVDRTEILEEGTYTYRRISFQEARQWLTADDFRSKVNCAETTAAAVAAFGVHIPFYRNCPPLTMLPGDEALVFRIVPPKGTPRLFQGKEGISIEFECDVGLLTRVA
jgi:hypothetical protein